MIEMGNPGTHSLMRPLDIRRKALRPQIKTSSSTVMGLDDFRRDIPTELFRAARRISCDIGSTSHRAVYHGGTGRSCSSSNCVVITDGVLASRCASRGSYPTRTISGSSPIVIGIETVVPGVLGPLELGVVVFTPLGVPVPFVPLLVALIPLLPDPVPDVAPAPLETPPEPVLAAPTPAPAAPPAPAEAPPAAPPPPAAQLIVASPDVKARVSAITAGRFMTMPSCRKHALSVRYENEANGTLVPAAPREL